MRNLSLIDKPEVIAGLELFDIGIAAAVALVPALILSMISIYLFVTFPGGTLLGALWLRERKREKQHGYFQRLIYCYFIKPKIFYPSQSRKDD